VAITGCFIQPIFIYTLHSVMLFCVCALWLPPCNITTDTSIFPLPTSQLTLLVLLYIHLHISRASSCTLSHLSLFYLLHNITGHISSSENIPWIRSILHTEHTRIMYTNISSEQVITCWCKIFWQWQFLLLGILEEGIIS